MPNAFKEGVFSFFRTVANELPLPAASGRPTLDRFISLIKPAFEEVAKDHGYDAVFGEAKFKPIQTKLDGTNARHAWRSHLTVALQPKEDGAREHQIQINIVHSAGRHLLSYKGTRGTRNVKSRYKQDGTLSHALGSYALRDNLTIDAHMILTQILDGRGQSRGLKLIIPGNHL